MCSLVTWLPDLIWIFGDANRQPLRDKLANTYVVKANAQAAGQGRIIFRYYSICLSNCLFREVEVKRERNERYDQADGIDQIQTSP